MNICLPFAVIEPILDRLNAQIWFAKASKPSTAQSIANIQRRLNQAQVPISVELGRASITVGEMLNVNVGDVIQLDQYVKGLLDVKIGNQVKFQGTPGVSSNRIAVQIGKIVREG